MDTSDAVKSLQEAIGKIKRLRGQKIYSSDHVAFVQSTGLELGRIFGPDSVVSRNFNQINYSFVGSFFSNPWDFETERARKNQEAYLMGLDLAEGILLSAIEQLQKHGADEILTKSRIKLGGGRIFISHGNQTLALTKVERFIRALGLEPVMVIREASQGMSVDDLVDKKMNECDCAIILATADDNVSGYMQPRPNVIHEIGLAQEKLQNKVIYLKEEACEFPSNVRPKVWENFTQENMEAAFEKISKELRAFGLL